MVHGAIIPSSIFLASIPQGTDYIRGHFQPGNARHQLVMECACAGTAKRRCLSEIANGFPGASAFDDPKFKSVKIILAQLIEIIVPVFGRPFHSDKAATASILKGGH